MTGPLRIEYAEPAEAEIIAAYDFMQDFGFDSAENWLKGMIAALEAEAALQAALPVRRPLAAEVTAGGFPGRAVYVLQYVTRGGSPWRLLCELTDADGDGETDTLRLVGVRHAAQRGPSDPM